MSGYGWRAIAEHLSAQELSWRDWFDRCPFCHATGLNISGESSTLLGGGDGTREGDPNHYWALAACNTCNARFIRETKEGRIWFTERRENGGQYDTHGNGMVIAGLPNCFEHYLVKCKCGGRVAEHVYELDGETRRTSGVVSFSSEGRDHRVFYECDTCQMRLEDQ